MRNLQGLIPRTESIYNKTQFTNTGLPHGSPSKEQYYWKKRYISSLYSIFDLPHTEKCWVEGNEPTRVMMVYDRDLNLRKFEVLNHGLAYKVCLSDDEVDEIDRDICDKIEEVIKIHPDRVAYLINLLLISRHLERIADHATNIAEEVIYMVEGEISGHRKDIFKPDDASTE